MEHQKDYDKLRYSQRDIYAIIAKTIVPIIALVLIYARFLNVENNQKEIVKDIKELKIKIDEEKGKMYRHVSEKEEEMTGRLNRKTERIEKDILQNTFQIKTNTERIIVLETTE